MYFSVVVAIAVLPFLVAAVPVSLGSRADRPISVPLTRRSNHLKDDRSADLGNLQAGLRYRKAVFDRALTAYEENTGQPHPFALKRGDSNERRAFVSTPLTVEGVTGINVAWSGDIIVGTPGRSFTMSFDLVSADMYIDGPSCKGCSGKNFYDISLSSTGKNLSSNIATDFSFAKVVGDVVTESVFLGGFEVANQKIFVANSITNPRFTFPNSSSFSRDGVMGLGFPPASAFLSDSYFGSLVNSGGLKDEAPVIGFYLTDSNPELVIGGTDTSKFSGEIKYVNVSTPIFWEVPMDNMSINGNVAVTNKEAILDSADLFISSNNDTIAKIYSNIPGSRSLNADLWTIPCDGPDIHVTVTLGGISFDIPSFGLGSGDSSVVLQDIPGSCVGPFAVRDDPSPLLHFGTTFMQHFYTELDLKNRRIGFAPI